MMEVFFRYTDEHLHRLVTILTVMQKINYSQRKGSQRTTRRLSKEHFYQSQAEQTLPLTERGANTFHLIEYYIGSILLFQQEMLQCTGHRRIFLCRSLQVES